jgi:hypothetical protein
MNSPLSIMLRIAVGIAALLGVLSACGETPQPPAAGPNLHAAEQGPNQQEIPVEKIIRDVVGRVVQITAENGNGMPTEWTFEAGEFKQAEIVETEITAQSATLVIVMTTRNNPGPQEDAVQVTGRLLLRYQRDGGVWVLKTIGNLTFR